MKPRHKVSRAGLELIKSFEGYRRSAAQLADGRWTIGYGHTKTARQGAEVSEQDAEALLFYDLIAVAAAVNDLTFTPMTQNQFDALASFAFNVGVEPFRKSAVLRRVNEGSMLQAAWALEMWRKADFEGEQIVVDALVRRRAAEKALFLTPADGWVAAPSPVLPPKFDADAGAGVPTGRPVELVASLEGETATVEREPAPAEPETAAPVQTSEALAAPSLSQMADATEVMSARLEALLPTPAAATPLSESHADLDPHSPPETPMETPADTAGAIVPSESELLEPPVPEIRWSNRIADTQAEPAEASEHKDAMPALAEISRQPIYRERVLDDAKSSDGEVQPAKFGFAPYLIAAVAGLVILAAALTWAVSAPPSSGMSPLAIGVSVAFVGIALVAWSIYSLIIRFSGRED
jgi:lysozyme